MHESLDQLRQDERLEDGSARGVNREVRGRTDPEQGAQETCVEEVQLRAPDEPLAEVRVMGTQ